MTVLHEELLAGEGREEFLVERLEVRDGHGSIDLAPGNSRLARWFANDELVVGRPARVRPRPAYERAVGRDQSLLAADRFLVQCGSGQVPPHAVGLNAFALEPSSRGKVAPRDVAG